MSSTVGSWMRGNALALLALGVALGGTSYAAVSLPRDSVKAPQIAAGAVGSSEIRDGAVGRADLRPGVLPVGRLAPLQAGETVHGYVGADEIVTTAGVWHYAFASFPLPLAGEPTKVFVAGVTPGETCTGDSGSPTAPRNTLCLYPVVADNPAPASGSHQLLGVSRYGFQVAWVPSVAGESVFLATYAFTEGG